MYPNQSPTMVPVVGLEPTRCRHQRILSYLRQSEGRSFCRHSQDVKEVRKSPDNLCFFGSKGKSFRCVCIYGFWVGISSEKEIGGQMEAKTLKSQ